MKERKLGLELEKLAFERLRYTEDRSKRERELEKLDAELAELNKPLWRKASSIGAFATIAVAIVAGLLTFGTDILKSNIRSLSTQRADLAHKLTSLQKQKQGLTTQVASLTASQADLLASQATLRQSNHTLSSERAVLEAQNSGLQVQNVAAKKPIQLAPLGTALEILSKTTHSTFGITAAATAESEAFPFSYIDTHQRDPEVARSLREAFSSEESLSAKFLIALALYRATQDPQWKGTAVEMVFAKQSSVFGPASVDKLFALQTLKAYPILAASEKSAFYRRMFHSLFQEATTIDAPVESDNAELKRLREENNKLSVQAGSMLLCYLADWDKEEAKKFPASWLFCKDYLTSQYKKALLSGDREASSGLPAGAAELFNFSEEVYGVIFLQRIGGTETLRPTSGEQITPFQYRVSGEGCPAFTPTFPLCSDWQKRARLTSSGTVLYYSENDSPTAVGWLLNRPDLTGVVNSGLPGKTTREKVILDSLIERSWVE